MGLLQGEVLSPILFSMYINDIEINFIKENCPSVDIQLITIFLLMDADDRVLIAESPQNLHKMLDTLYDYCDEWKLEDNVQKTKIVAFRNG